MGGCGAHCGRMGRILSDTDSSHCIVQSGQMHCWGSGCAVQWRLIGVQHAGARCKDQNSAPSLLHDVIPPRMAACCTDAVLDKAGVWGAPLAPDSPLLSAATCAKLSPAEAAQVPRLAQVLLLTHQQRLKKGETTAAVCALRGWGLWQSRTGQCTGQSRCTP